MCYPRDLKNMNSAVQRFSVVTAFTLLAILLAGNTLVTRRQLAAQTDRQQWLLHTRLIRYEIQQTLALLEDAETGQRGYLYTGESRYLPPYNSAVAEMDQQLRQLSDLTADDPAQVANVASVRSLAHQKLRELAATIDLYRAGKNEDARKLVLSGSGENIMDSLRRVLGQMEKEEESLEDAQSVAYQRSVQRTVNSIYFSTGVAILGLAIVAQFILRQRRMRDRYTRQLRAREEWFRVTLQSIGDGVIATDEKGRVTFLNPVASALTGVPLEDALQREIHDVFPIFNEQSGADAENPVQRVMSLGIVVGLANHTVLKHRDGRLTPIEDSAAPIRDDRNKIIGVVLVFRDAALERKSQELMRRAEKLAAAARLSATVAHEINNPLEAVMNLVYLAKVLPGASPAIIEKLHLAEQELERVSHIVRQTLGFYRESSRACPHRDRAPPRFSSQHLQQQDQNQGNRCPVPHRRLPCLLLLPGGAQAGPRKSHRQRHRRGRTQRQHSRHR